MLSCVVHAASVQDRRGEVWDRPSDIRLRPPADHSRADAGYAGRLAAAGCVGHASGRWRIIRFFAPQKALWSCPNDGSERTFAWLGKRRLSKDYEILEASSEAFIYVAMIHIMVRRLN
ncbi:MAG: hypothetical protein R3B91_18880 [Planctomycetaceae bacterium]